MSIYECGFATAAVVTVAPIFDLHTAGGGAVQILEIGIFTNAATTSFAALYRPLTVGTPTGPITGVPTQASVDPAPTALVSTTWSAAPTVTAAASLRRIQLPANIGAGVIWTWAPGQLRVPISSSIICWNFGGSTNSVLNCYVKWEE